MSRLNIIRIAYMAFWFVTAQFALYTALNGWVMNPWLQVNFYGFGLFGWAGGAYLMIIEESTSE